MKKLFLLTKLLLTAALFGVGTSVWAVDEYSAVYTKTLTVETAWTSSDLTAWGVAENSKFSVSETTGLTLSVNGESHSASYTVSSIATTSKVKYVVEWNVGSVVANNTNNTTNNTYLMFGDKLRLSYDRGYNVYWSTDGTFVRDEDHKVSGNSAKEKTVTVTLIYDPILRTVESFTTSGINSYANDLTSTVNKSLSKENIDMRKVTFGYFRTGNNTNITTSLKSIITSECTQDVPAGHRYTINAIDGNGNLIKSLKSEYAANGEAISIASLNLVLYKNDTYYELNDDGVTNYAKSFTMINEEATFTVTYKEASDIVYFKEAESFAGSNNSSAESRASGGAYTAYFKSNTINNVTKLNKGVYRVETYIWSRTDQHINLYNTSKDDANILAQLTGSGSQSKIFLIGTDNTQTILGCTNNSCCFDYILIRKLHDITEVVGETDFTTNYNTTWNTTPIWINVGETGYYKFVNFNNTSSTNLYENWYLFGATESSENIVIFGPNHSNTNTNGTYTIKPTYSQADLNGAVVELYTSLDDASDGTYTLTTKAVTTKADGTTLTPDLVYTQTGLNASKLKLYVSPEKNYLGIIEQTSPIAITAKVSSYGYASFSSTYNLDFSAVEGLTAFIATGSDDNNVTLEEVDDAQAGTGLVLKGAEGTYSIPVIASGTDHSATNKLWAITSDGTVGAANDANYTNYVLASQGGKVVFAPVTGNNTAPVKAGQAALSLQTAGTGARALSISFDDEATGINTVESNTSIENDVIYNLRGQRVSQPTKGLYIVGGKKVMVK